MLRQERWTLPCDLDAPGVARLHLADTCQHLAADAVAAAMLLTSELVTNAVRHSAGPVLMALECDDEELRVEVEDGTRRPPVPRPRSLLAEGGRGLMIVDAYADAWGTEPRDEGKAVWFVLRTDRA